jgi:hypothetical protein
MVTVWLGVGEMAIVNCELSIVNGVVVGGVLLLETAVAIVAIVDVGLCVTVAARPGTEGIGVFSGRSTLCTCQTNKLIGIKNIRINPIRRRIHLPLAKDEVLSLSVERPSNNALPITAILTTDVNYVRYYTSSI